MKKSLFSYFKLIISFDKRLLFILIFETFINTIYYFFGISVISFVTSQYQANPSTLGFKKVFWFLIAYVLLKIILNAVVTYIYSYLISKIERNITKKVTLSLYKKIDEIDFDVYQSNEFLNKYEKSLDETFDHMLGFFWAVTNIISPLVSLIGISTLLSLINPIIILYAIIVGTLSFLFSAIYIKLNYKLGEKNQQLIRERAYIKRLFFLKDSAIDIKTTNLSDLYLNMEEEIGNKVIHNINDLRLKSSMISFLSEFLIRTIFYFALGLIVYITLEKNNIVIIASLISAASSFSDNISTISHGIGQLRSEAVYRFDYYRVMDEISNIEIKGISNEQLLEFNKIMFSDVSFAYPHTDKETLSNISITIKKNDKIALVGENGAGKTSFVKLLLRLYDPSNGNILINDENYKHYNPSYLRKHFVCVFQNYQVFACSIAENILLRKIKSPKDIIIVEDALKKVGLYEKVNQLEDGINTNCTKEFDQNGLEMSGGERQKLVIARIFASNAPIIVLDEPNSALDAFAEKSIFDEIFKYSFDRTLIFISHRLSTTINADQIMLFEKGKILERGTHNELMNIKNGRYKEMFVIQAKEYQEGRNYDEK